MNRPIPEKKSSGLFGLSLRLARRRLSALRYRIGQEIAQIGLIGLGTMGANLALNIAEKGYPIAVFNPTFASTTGIRQCLVRRSPQGHLMLDPAMVDQAKSSVPALRRVGALAVGIGFPVADREIV